jgi:hypothetical protein
MYYKTLLSNKKIFLENSDNQSLFIQSKPEPSRVVSPEFRGGGFIRAELDREVLLQAEKGCNNKNVTRGYEEGKFNNAGGERGRTKDSDRRREKRNTHTHTHVQSRKDPQLGSYMDGHTHARTCAHSH